MNKLRLLIAVFVICFSGYGCSKKMYMTDIETGKKNRVIPVDKYIKTDTTGHNGIYYVSRIEKYPRIYVIYLSYEGRTKILLSKINNEHINKNKKISVHKFYNFIMKPIYHEEPKRLTILPDPKIYEFSDYIIYWELNNVTERDIYESLNTNGIYIIDK